MKNENEGNANSVPIDWEHRRLAEIRRMPVQQQFDLAFGVFLGTRVSLDLMWADLQARIGGPKDVADALRSVAQAAIRPRLRFVGDSIRFLPFEGNDLLAVDMAGTGYLHARALLPLLGFLRADRHDPHQHITTSYLTTPEISMNGTEHFRPLLLHFLCTKFVACAPAVAPLMAQLWVELMKTPCPEWSDEAVDARIKRINVIY